MGLQFAKGSLRFFAGISRLAFTLIALCGLLPLDCPFCLKLNGSVDSRWHC
jgi:hypothetical protein